MNKYKDTRSSNAPKGLFMSLQHEGQPIKKTNKQTNLRDWKRGHRQAGDHTTRLKCF